MPTTRSAGLSHSRSTYSAQEAAQHGLSLFAEEMSCGLTVAQWSWFRRGEAHSSDRHRHPTWWHVDFSGQEDPAAPGWLNCLWRGCVSASRTAPFSFFIPGPGDALFKGNGFCRDIRKKHPCATPHPGMLLTTQSLASRSSTHRKPHMQIGMGASTRLYLHMFRLGFGALLCNETIGNYQVDYWYTIRQYGWSK